MSEKKTIGILGGMGPMATADLFTKIIKLTDAKRDYDHIHIIIDNYPQIPDRTRTILSGNNLPVSFLINAAQRLEKAGADFIIIPCNTSHFFLEQIQQSVSIPIINMIEEVAKNLQKQEIHCVGILATDGVLKSGLYETVLQKYEICIKYPCPEAQKNLMSIIYDEIKANRIPRPEKIFSELDHMIKNGAEAFVLGCTELPLAFNGIVKYRLIDCTDILARVAIQKAGYSIKEEGSL